MSEPMALVSSAERAFIAVARTGRLGREVGAHAQMLASLGPRSAIGGFLEARRYARVAPAVDAEFYRSLWRQAADELGASMIDEPAGVLRFELNGSIARTQRQWTTLDDVVTVRASLDKALVKQRLAELEIPMPDSVELRLGDIHAGEGFLRAAKSVVVKPARGTGGGMGITSGVKTVSMLRRAVLVAARRSDSVLVERQVPGAVYRLLFLDGELLDVVRRDPPSVSGDGRSTVRELIAAENRRRWSAHGQLGLQLISVTLDSVCALEGQGLDLGKVPAPGSRVPVRGVTNQSGPQDSTTFAAPLADGLVETARRSVQAIGLRLAGVDVITSDPGARLGDVGGVLLEVNGGPGLHHHYLVSDRAAAQDVCTPILRRALGAG